MSRHQILPALAVVLVMALGAADPVSHDEAEGTLNAGMAEMSVGGGSEHHFWNGVEIRYPGMDLDCEELWAQFFPDGQKIDRMVASNKVLITITQLGTNAPGIPGKSPGSGTFRIHAALAVYTATNDTITLTGSPEFGQPWVEGAEGTFRGDVLIFERGSSKLRGKNFRMIIRPDALPKGAFDPVKTSQPASPPPVP